MKCVKNITTGEIIRVEGWKADKMIKTKEWIFARKEEWKAYKKNLNQK